MRKTTTISRTGLRFSGDSLRKWLIFIIAFLIYTNSINNDYNLDDGLVTRQHPLTSKGFQAIPEIFTSPYYQDAMGYQYDYRPIALTSFAIEHALLGENPHVSHAINVLLYAILCVIVYSTLLALFGTENNVLVLLSTLLFLIHPIHTEVVCSIKNRDEILALLFGLLSLKTSLRYARISGKSHQALLLIAVVILYGMALMSKRSSLPFALAIPFALVLFQPKTSLLKISTLSVMLAIPAVLFIPLNFRNEKILAFILISAFPSTVYLFIYHSRQILMAVYQGGIYIKHITLQGIAFSKNFARNHTTAAWNYLKTSGKWILRRTLIILILALITVNIFYPWSVIVMICAASLITGLILTDKKEIYFMLMSLFLLVTGLQMQQPEQCIFFPLFYLIYCLLKNKNPINLSTGFLYLLSMVAIILTKSFAMFIPLLVASASFVLYYRKKYYWLLTILFIYLINVFFFSLHELLMIESIHPLDLMRETVNLLIVVSILIGFIFFDKKTTLVYILVAGMIVRSIVSFMVVENFSGFARVTTGELPNFMTNATVLNSLPFTDETKCSPASQPHYMAMGIMNIFNVSAQPVNTYEQDQNNLAKPGPQSPSIVPIAGRRLDFVETPLLYESDPQKHFATATYILGKYLQLMIFPHPLRFYYGYNQIPIVTFTNPFAFFSALIYTFLLIISVLLIRKHPVLSFGIIFYLLFILPFSNIYVAVAGMVAERLAFSASLGFCIAFSWIFLKAFKLPFGSKSEWRIFRLKPWAAALLLLLCTAATAKTVVRNTQWKDELTLYTHDMKYLNQSAQAHNLLARTYMSLYEKTGNPGFLDKAISHFKRAVAIYPDFFNVWFDLGLAYMSKNDFDNAIKAFKRNIEIDPSLPSAFYYTGYMHDLKEQNDLAEYYYKEAIRLDSANLSYYTSLSYLYFKTGKPEKSIKVNLLALKFNPNRYEPYVNIGKTYLQSGNLEKAIEYFEKAYALNKNDPLLTSNLIRLYEQTGNFEKAARMRSGL